MNAGLVNTEQLQAWLGYERPGDVLKWLSRKDIAFFTGRDGKPVTTVEALNAALRMDDSSSKGLEFDGQGISAG